MAVIAAMRAVSIASGGGGVPPRGIRKHTCRKAVLFGIFQDRLEWLARPRSTCSWRHQGDDPVVSLFAGDNSRHTSSGVGHPIAGRGGVRHAEVRHRLDIERLGPAITI